MLHDFSRRVLAGMYGMQSKLQRDLTMRSRVERRFSITEMAGFFGVDGQYLSNRLKRLEDRESLLPTGIKEGREKRYTPSEMLLIRAMLSSLPASQDGSRVQLNWRKPSDPLPVVTFGAQKGGTGKSLSSAHFAQYISLNYGLRVGVIDADPQSTVSLYFADTDLQLFHPDTQTVASFMGVEEPGTHSLNRRSAEELNAIWQPTPWPAIRLIPGGDDIPNADISMFFMATRSGEKVHRILRDAIQRWDEGFPPETTSDNLRDDYGAFDMDAYTRGLTESLDVIVVDQPPSLTVMQLNGLVAATNVIVPQTMKGFDLSTLTTYMKGIDDYLSVLDDSETFGAGRHTVLPTIVQESNERDVAHLADLYRHCPQDVSQVWYTRSDAIANAAEEYKSIYEYDAPRTRRASAKAFTDNANAVNDRLVQLVWPDYTHRGYADEFIKREWN
ncbi:AAA family ATPase [Palleronia sp.]|uniref:AAA family ATPase n=1 Tax=Palleronia sp. TaxID=1940284 RepID=UPI0035C8778C